MLDARVRGGLSVVEPPRSIEATEQRSSVGGKRVKGEELTGRQMEGLGIIRRHVRRRGVPPSRTELASEMGLANPSAVDGHLNALAKKGWIELLPSVERGIRLLREGAPLVDVVDLPAVAAGTPILADERREPARLNDFDSFANQFEAKPDYFLKVTGDSLDKVGFHSGDIVAVCRQPEARNGDIVVARIGQEITLKRFERVDQETVELQPVSTNPEHHTIAIGRASSDTEIVGVVVGAIVGRGGVPSENRRGHELGGETLEKSQTIETQERGGDRQSGVRVAEGHERETPSGSRKSRRGGS